MKMTVVFMLSFWTIGGSVLAQAESGSPEVVPVESVTSTESVTSPAPLELVAPTAPLRIQSLRPPAEPHSSEHSLGGEVHFMAEAFQMPTGKRGKNSFQVPSILIHKDVALEKGHFLKFRLRASDTELRGEEVAVNSPSSKVYLELHASDAEGPYWQVGLVPNPVNELSRQRWSLDRLGSATYSFADKYGYFADSDTGLAYRSLDRSDKTSWAFRVVNGASARDKEDGFHKDGQIFIMTPLKESGVFAFNYTRGQYDKYAPKLGAKERLWFHLGFRPRTGLGISLEAFRSQDPAELVNGFLADQVDLTSASGKSVYGAGASIQMVYVTSFGSEVFLRGDQVEAVTNIKGLQRKLSSTLVGYSRPLSSQVFANLAYEHVSYSKEYQVGYRDQGRALLGLAVVF